MIEPFQTSGSTLNILGDRSEMDSVLHSCPFVPKGFGVGNIHFCICFWKMMAFVNLSDGRTAGEREGNC